MMFSIALVQASERRSGVGSLRRATVSISSSPSRRLAATPGACCSSRRARLRSSRSALSASSSSQACRSARRTEASAALAAALSRCEPYESGNAGSVCGSEGPTNDLTQRLGTVDDEQPAELWVEPALDQIVDQRLHHGSILGRPFDQGERMFVAVCIDPERADQHQIVADVQAVDLDHQQVQLGQGQMPSTRPAGQPTAPQTAVRPPTSRCRHPRAPADASACASRR